MKGLTYGLIEVDDAIDLIASLEVRSLPSDNPELLYWKGFAAAQLEITNLLRTTGRKKNMSIKVCRRCNKLDSIDLTSASALPQPNSTRPIRKSRGNRVIDCWLLGNHDWVIRPSLRWSKFQDGV